MRTLAALALVLLVPWGVGTLDATAGEPPPSKPPPPPPPTRSRS